MAQQSKPKQQKKRNSSKQSGKPSSLAHYTSLAVLHSLLQGAIEGGMITLHLSHQRMMNDPYEGILFLNKFFTNSNKKKRLKKKWDSYYREHAPFVFSAISSDDDTKKSGDLTMWKMYGDDFHGVLIKFNFEQIDAFAKDNKYILDRCNYQNNTGFDAFIKELNNTNKKSGYNDSFWERLLRLSITTKYSYWKQENEWRLVVTQDVSTAKTKQTARGIILYYEINIPIDFISEIIIGPKCDQTITIPSLEVLKAMINKDNPNKAHFTISQSSAKIR